MKKLIKTIFSFFKCLICHVKYNKSLYIGHHVKILNGNNVNIGRNVSIRPYTELFCYNISIGDGTDIGTRNRFDGEVIVGKNVLFGPDNYITSITHKYDDISRPILSQGAIKINKKNRGFLEIGDGSWIGIHCVLIGDIKIGKNCVIGANSVVTKDIPDYCVVCGNPAQIIKKYNFDTGKWERCKND